LLVTRLPAAAGSAGHTSGTVVVYGPIDTIDWLRKYYKLSP
jgi:hypothetical protein